MPGMIKHFWTPDIIIYDLVRLDGSHCLWCSTPTESGVCCLLCHVNLMLSDGGVEMKMGGNKVGLFACFVTSI